MGEEEEVFFGSLAGVALLICAVPVVLGESLLSSHCRIFVFLYDIFKKIELADSQRHSKLQILTIALIWILFIFLLFWPLLASLLFSSFCR